MSTEATEMQHDDPFAVPAEEPPAYDDVPEDAFDDEFEDILDGLDLEEEESGEAIQIRGAGKEYDDPAEVGLKDLMWVPIRILTSEVKDKHVPRMNKKTCVAKKDGKVVAIRFDDVEAALRAGAEEVIGEIPLPYFVATANHAAPQFGQRRWDWEVEVPVFTVKTALFKEQKNRTGFKNESGRSLRLATGATVARDKVTKENMHEVADRMVETIVMAQISLSKPKKKMVDVLDDEKRRVNVLCNAEDGEPVFIHKMDDGSGYVVEGSGEIWEGDEGLLFPVGDRFAIRDEGDSSNVLRVEKPQCTDYLKDKFLPVPERMVEVDMLDGSGKAKGEITLDTVGAIAVSKQPGFMVDVLMHNGASAGKTVRAVWLGTQWSQVDGKSAADEFSGSTENTGIESL